MGKFGKRPGQYKVSGVAKSSFKSATDNNLDSRVAIQSQTGDKSNGSDGAAKLSKQERRNLNKKNKQLISDTNVQIVKAAPTESVYKRETEYPTTMTDSNGPWDRFVTPSDPEYKNIIDTAYRGFHVSTRDKFEDKFHSDFTAALEGLDVEGFYQYDITQPQGLGTKTAKTFVTRCLVGDVGTTYKYLGLRMFSIPWNAGVDDRLTSPHALTIGKLNEVLVGHSAKLLKQANKPKVGSCQYNLTLINRCFPEKEATLKMEPGFEKDKCTVSWHADSTLDHFSTIGVYHCTSRLPCSTTASALPSSATAPRRKDKRRHKSADSAPVDSADAANNDDKKEEEDATVGSKRPLEAYVDTVVAESKTEEMQAEGMQTEEGEDLSWRVALRVWYDAEGPNAAKVVGSRAGEMQMGEKLAPAVAVPLPSGAAYFLLDDFNHHHQHSVLAGNTYRYASTHRVCKTEGHTFQSVQTKALRLLQTTGKAQYQSKAIRLEQLMMNEIEFEWLRQFYIQGEKHRQLHQWWHKPIQELHRLWNEFGDRTILALNVLRTAATFNYQNKWENAKQGSEVAAATPEQRAERKKWAKWSQRLELVDSSSFTVMSEMLRERHEKRAGWTTREKDTIFSTLAKDCAPLPCPMTERLLQQQQQPLKQAKEASAKPEANAPAPEGDLDEDAGQSSGGDQQAQQQAQVVAQLEQLPRVTSLLNMAECVDQWLKAFESNASRKAASGKKT